MQISPLERLQLLGATTRRSRPLDEIDVHGHRDREMLRELARTSPGWPPRDAIGVRLVAAASRPPDPQSLVEITRPDAL